MSPPVPLTRPPLKTQLLIHALLVTLPALPVSAQYRRAPPARTGSLNMAQLASPLVQSVTLSNPMATVSTVPSPVLHVKPHPLTVSAAISTLI